MVCVGLLWKTIEGCETFFIFKAAAFWMSSKAMAFDSRLPAAKD
jgi:hypothetical protein